MISPRDVRKAVLLAIAVAAAVGLAGCAGGSANPKENMDASAPTLRPFVIDQDFPDPDVLLVKDTYYAYATNTAATNVQFATSSDLESWAVSAKDALPELPAWAAPGKTWAPDVSEVSPGKYLLYFVAASIEPSAQCIGVATGDSPEGPFTAVGDASLICPDDEGGAIDPSTFLDSDGTRYLVWKNDGNCCGLDTWLQLSPLSADGTTLAGPPTKLLKQTEDWEGDLIEAPTLVQHGQKYVLLYSANSYSGPSYAIGYATAAAAAGPYTKHPGPLLTTELAKGTVLGPGGQDIAAAPDGTDRLVIHSWDEAFAYRGMNVLPLGWKNDEPVAVF